MNKFYITTPIYYINAAPHIGHTYCTMAADAIARFKKMQGFEVVLTSGTDEHGQKIERAAQAVGKTPQAFADIIAAEWQAQWSRLGVRIDRFLRTTDPKHEKKVQELFQRCLANGYIYKGSYTGQYCVSCELYVNEAKPGDPCPDCARPTETVTEENFFFKLSAFQDKLLALYEAQPDLIQPTARRNEVIAFVKGGLSDLSISRTSIKWGIPVPDQGKHVFYVWFDALMTYMSAVDGEGRWPADVHLIGKEIIRFHAVYWLAFLLAADWPLPKKIYAHGWLMFEEDKMSKSKGNIVRADPIREVVGVEGLRYFLLREIVFGQDGSFSYDALVGRYNSDLANGLGNLVSRTLTMINQYRGGLIPAASGIPEDIVTAAKTAIESVQANFEAYEFSKGLETLWGLLSVADKFIVEQAPWKLAKSTDADAPARLDATLYASAEVVRIATILLAPVMPVSTAAIWSQLGFTGSMEDVRVDQLAWGQLPVGQKIGIPAAVFPRIDAKPAIDKMRELEIIETARQKTLLGIKDAPAKDYISIDDFAKVELRVGQVLSAEPVKGADKLLHLKIDIGEPTPRTIVAGIAEAYTPEAMIGRKVVIVANLAPRKLRGIESQGMIVAASLEGAKPTLAGFLEDVPVGARLK